MELTSNSLVVVWTIRILMAGTILIAGHYLSRYATALFGRLVANKLDDEILLHFFKSLLRAALLVLVVIAALDQIGFDTTSLIAVLGAAGLAVGLALKDSLQNFAAGIMLIIFRPFKSGDYVEAAGQAGVAERIGIFSTTFRTPDNREVIIPNGGFYSGAIVNYSHRETRRIDLIFGIGYGDDIAKAKEVVARVLAADSRILNDPAPLIVVGELGDSSVNLFVRPWVAVADYWDVRYDLLEKVKLAFDEEGITIPFPQRDVHMYQVK